MDGPLAYFNTTFGQSFAVLSGCRMLQTLEIGTVQSKLAGVNWSEHGLDMVDLAFIRRQ